MELKHHILMVQNQLLNPFNRTILELKLKSSPFVVIFKDTFNRTILELKQSSTTLSFNIKCLLIEPYWNWNNILSTLPTLNLYSFNRTILELKQRTFFAKVLYLNAFNRTILELKHNLLTAYLAFLSAFNRTILELKPQKSLLIICTFLLLIEPYWNWNTDQKKKRD